MIKTGTKGGRHDRVLDLFEREREVLLNGPLRDLQGLVAEREALVEAILADADPTPEPVLAAMKAKAMRNGHLLAASLAGLRAAREQIEESEAAARTLRTYTAAGTSVDVAGPGATRDHRR